MVARHKSLHDLWDEWFGLSAFADDLGGINGRNQKFKSKWRKHLNTQQYSRIARIIAGIEKHANDNSVPWGDSIDALSQAFIIDGNCSVYNMVVVMQEQGLLPKKASRGKNK